MAGNLGLLCKCRVIFLIIKYFVSYLHCAEPHAPPGNHLAALDNKKVGLLAEGLLAATQDQETTPGYRT